MPHKLLHCALLVKNTVAWVMSLPQSMVPVSFLAVKCCACFMSKYLLIQQTSEMQMYTVLAVMSHYTSMDYNGGKALCYCGVIARLAKPLLAF